MSGARRRRPEQGAATLETTGVVIIASIVIAGVLAAALPQARAISETFSYYVCQVVTFGQGGCAPPSASAEAHEPTEPCVLAQQGVERNSKIAVLVVTLEDGRRIELQDLSNGEHKVTVTDTGGAGLETGVGGGLSLTVNDRTVGGKASAGVSASLDFKQGDVYYADDAGLPDLMDALTQDQIKDTVAGNSGPTRWLADRATDIVGVSNDLPAPDETYAEGGFSVGASAEATGGPTSAKAGVGAAEVLGTRTNRDDTTTVYLKSSVEGEAGLQSIGADTEGNPEFQGAALSGKAEVVTAVTFDAEGNMTRVQASSAAQGSSAGMTSALFGGSADPSLANQEGAARVYQSTLEIESGADQDVANRFLLSQGVGALGGYTNPALAAEGVSATQGFFEAARDRGITTQQDYDTSNSTPFAVDASGKWGVELGGAASVTKDTMTTAGAEYWDGTDWVEWEECAG